MAEFSAIWIFLTLMWRHSNELQYALLIPPSQMAIIVSLNKLLNKQ